MRRVLTEAIGEPIGFNGAQDVRVRDNDTNKDVTHMTTLAEITDNFRDFRLVAAPHEGAGAGAGEQATL